jgi:hypothetical protein
MPNSTNCGRIGLSIPRYKLLRGASVLEFVNSAPNEMVVLYVSNIVVHMRFIVAFLLFSALVEADPSLPLTNPSILLTRAIANEEGREDVGYDVLPLPDGGAIVSGSTNHASGTLDGLLMHLNGKGDVLWRKVYGGGGLDLIFSAHPDRDGFLCVGFKATRGEPGLKGMDGWILKIDTSGNIVWEQTYGGAGEDRLTGIRKTADGWMAVGHTEVKGNIRAWVLRIDAKGNQIESWTDDSAFITKGLDVLPLQDGSFVIAGYQGDQRDASDGFVFRIDAVRRKTWTHLIGGNGYQVGYHMQPFRDGSYLVIGYGAFENRPDHQAYVLKLSPDGKPVYQKTFGGPTHDRATNALILENETVIIAGQTQRAGAQEEDTGWDMILYALDRSGSPVWSGRHGGSGVEFGRAVKGDPQNLWIIGHTTSEQSGSNVLMIRMDASAFLELHKS